jgi:hypothetical protein
MNVQVACTLTGDLAWISDPVDEAGMTPTAWVNQEFSGILIPASEWLTKDTSAMA